MTLDFAKCFKALTGHEPLKWQKRLFDRLRVGDIPAVCDLPTGLGKTSVIPIWLIGLAVTKSLPRRLVYVVNRRTVVDQATSTVERLRGQLSNAGNEVLRRLKTELQALSAGFDDTPLAISTLRGQFADNGEWRADPARPAVIVGTVDMIGSRLLFGGYGCGFKSGPLHAAFLGQDTLLVHDESHLEPAFQELIKAIEAEQKRCSEFKPLRVLAMSATARTDGKETFQLTAADQDDEIVQNRTRAKKWLALHAVDPSAVADRVADLALAYEDSGNAILVFLRELKDVEAVAKKLPKGRFEQLTGTIRGLERDSLVTTQVFQRFLPSSTRDANVPSIEGTVYLVCTSAGEVGIDISADHMVCDLTPFDSMAQRLGRVNRFGDGDACVDVVHPPKFEETSQYEVRRKRTLALLEQLRVRKDGRFDASPRGLDRIPKADRLEAFTPQPVVIPTSDILFDAWALTTIRGKLPGRPPVEPYLHGESEWELPETHVAWREEVRELQREFVIEDERRELQGFAEDLLEDYPLKPHELLRDRSDRVIKHLATLAQRHPEDPAWLVDEEGAVELFTLRELTDKDQRDRINDRTVLLPPDVGGLSTGLLDGKSAMADDVADEWYVDAEKTKRRRVRVWDDDPRFDEKTKDMRLIRRIVFEVDDDDVDAIGRSWYWFERPKSADNDGSKSATKSVSWQVHTDDVTKNAAHIAKALNLAPEFQQAIAFAAKFHDLGKRRERWQRSIGNPNPTNWLAKSGSKRKPVELSEYRHEFGSLLDVQNETEFRNLSDDCRELVLHIIAAHHGRGRPHFLADEVFDPEPKGNDLEKIAVEVSQRFARLQRQFGRWGLAYLESVLRAADYAASAKPSAFVEDEEQP